MENIKLSKEEEVKFWLGLYCILRDNHGPISEKEEARVNFLSAYEILQEDRLRNLKILKES